MKTPTWRFPRWSARLALFSYCALIFTISSISRPDEDWGMPTGAIPHFLEYAGLGVLAWLNLAGRTRRGRRRRWPALVFCALYAVSDELHQAFVPLRACEMKDWLIDLLGSGSGILLLELLIARKKIRVRITPG